MKHFSDFSHIFLKLENISLFRGRNCLLSHVTKEVSLDGFSLLKGRNGSGKTSFLYMLLSIIEPNEGTLSLWGRAPKEVVSYIGFMPQRMEEIAPMLPVMEHMLISLEGAQWGVSFSSKRYEKSIALLDEIGAVHLAKRPWGALSGGEKQRVLLALAIAKKPKLLILDEPLAALDSTAREEIIGILYNLQESYKISILMTAHESFNFISYFPSMREIIIEGKMLHV